MKSKIVVLIYLLSICFYANSQIGEKKIMINLFMQLIVLAIQF